MKTKAPRLWQRLRGFWGKEELQILGLNLGVHTLVQLIALQFMPLAYFSRLSLHDGNTYFAIAQNLWPAQPLTTYTWYKRFLHLYLGRWAIPWNMELSFLVVGIAAASLSAVFFYKIAARCAQHPFRLALLYSALPWLFFSAHHALAEPLMMLAVLAGFYYFLQERDWACIVAFALALLSKELAALPALAVGAWILYRRGWRRALRFSVACIPLAVVCVAYGLRWGDLTWYVKLGGGLDAEGYFSASTGLYWMARTLVEGTNSSANPTVALLYDIGNQLLNVIMLLSTAGGLYLLWKNGRRDLAFVNTFVLLPLLFLGYAQYNLSSSVGRKFLLVSLIILAYDHWVASKRPSLRMGYWLCCAAMLALGILWTFLYAKFFLFYKLF